MRQVYKIIFVFLAATSCFRVVAQKADSAFTRSVRGRVQDSTHNYVLSSATVAIYTAKDTSLVSYQLSNNFGEFRFDNLPPDIPLRLVATFVGYKAASRLFIISSRDKSIDLKNINMMRGEGQLSDVVITAIPPVRMNGDTLEFNADAFKLDKNAVAEDLLRKLPGVTVWGDGMITVNGRKVNEVLVEGKPFFGNDPRIATQNLPKGVIDKIQVYRQNKDRNNPFDSTTEVNIKLKADKKLGHFGKLGAGYGTGKTYESDASINYFAPRTQLGIVGAANNINKLANSVTQLMQNSTYKGVGANIEYQPDFSMAGTNKSVSAGLVFQHDFNEETDSKKENIEANYFFTKRDNNTLSSIQSITSIGRDSTLTQQNYSNDQSSETTHDFKAKYDINRPDFELTFLPSFQLHTLDNTNISDQSSTSNTQGLQSIDTSQNDDHSQKNLYTLETKFHRPKLSWQNNGPGDWTADYIINFEHDNDNRTINSNFQSLIVPAQSQHIIRNYNTQTDNAGQHLNAQLGNFSYWLFGTGNFMSTLGIDLQNEINFNTQNQNALVRDKDTLSGSYVANAYLTNHSKYNVVADNPSLNLSRAFTKSLADRYKKTLLVNVSAGLQLYSQKNTSEHTFQNFSRDYQRFIPTVSLKYSDNEYGYFENLFLLNYSETPGYATVEQLYPLVDSSNLYYVQEGNPGLKPSKKRQISLNFLHTSFKATNTFTYGLEVDAGAVDNYVADSAIIDASGGYRHYYVNLNGNKYLNGNGKLNKAFRIDKSNQLQVLLSGDLEFTQNPNYILPVSTNESVLNVSAGTNSYNSVSLIYSYRDILAINILQGLNFYSSRQDKITNTNFNNSSRNSVLSASVNCTGKLNVSSNITYNHYTSTGSSATNFTIWNANASYRFLKANNLGLKISALDLLHQNKSIINSGNNYTISHGSVNVLQQYFMLTVSYFPRKFGRKP